MSRFFTTRKTTFILIAAAVGSAMLIEPAMAVGGIEKVNTTINNTISFLRTASVGIVTIAIMWAAYKFLFKHADVSEVVKILAGGAILGGAAEIANFVLN